MERLAGRLAWALGGRSKISGDRISNLAGRLAAVQPGHKLRLARQKVSAAAGRLEAMSYRSVLGRGFSVTRRPAGPILRSAGEISDGEPIETELIDGRIASVVTGRRRPQSLANAEPTKPRKKKRQEKPDPGQPRLFD